MSVLTDGGWKSGVNVDWKIGTWSKWERGASDKKNNKNHTRSEDQGKNPIKTSIVQSLDGSVTGEMNSNYENCFRQNCFRHIDY